MKLLVFSDSHTAKSKILRAVDMHKGKCDLILFLGDGIRDVDPIKEKYPNVPVFMVKGNCDHFDFEDITKEAILDLDGIKVLVTHGDKHGVKYGYESILRYAIEKEVDAVFFGHTHVPCDKIEYTEKGKIHLFNPGSVAVTDTFGVVNTSNGVLITNIAKIH